MHTHYQRTLTHYSEDTRTLWTERESLPFDESIPSFVEERGVPELDALRVVNEWNKMAANAPNVAREGFVSYTYHLD